MNNIGNYPKKNLHIMEIICFMDYLGWVYASFLEKLIEEIAIII